MKSLNMFRLGLFTGILELVIFILLLFTGRFNFTIFVCIFYWAIWTIFYWNQRGKKCQLRIIPLQKDKIEIGDLVRENGFPLSGIVSGVSTCLTPGGSEYSPTAETVQLVVIDKEDERLMIGDTYLNLQTNEMKNYTSLEDISNDIGVVHAVFDEHLYAEKVIMIQKDMSEDFIYEVVQGKIKDRDTVLTRKYKVFKEKHFFQSKLMMGLIILFLVLILGDIAWSIINIFKTPEAKIIAGSINGLLIGTLLFFAIRKYGQLFKNK